MKLRIPVHTHAYVAIANFEDYDYALSFTCSQSLPVTYDRSVVTSTNKTNRYDITETFL